MAFSNVLGSSKNQWLSGRKGRGCRRHWVNALNVMTAQATFSSFSCNEEHMVWLRKRTFSTVCFKALCSRLLTRMSWAALKDSCRDAPGRTFMIYHWSQALQYQHHHFSFSTLQSATLTCKQLLYFAWELHFRCWEARIVIWTQITEISKFPGDF